MLGLAGATMFMGGCEKTDETPKREVELTFEQNRFDDLFYDDENGVRRPSQKAQEYIDDPTVGTIYLVPEGSWLNFGEIGIHALREHGLEPVMKYSPKFRGKGDFRFSLGAASTIPEDSLWFVSNGWTINKYVSSQTNQR